MRLPGTFNQKRGAWCRIVRADHIRPPVEPEAIRAVLPDPEPPRPEGGSSRQGNGTARPDDELALIAPPCYFLALCAVRVSDGGGMVRCPLPDHDDAYASCQVCAGAEQGWWCFGCSEAGGYMTSRRLCRAALGEVTCAVRRSGLCASWSRPLLADGSRPDGDPFAAGADPLRLTVPG
jgi:hypothetical protein